MKRMRMAKAGCSFIVWISILAITMLIISSHLGCSAVESINKDTSTIYNLSESSEGRFEVISELSDDSDINEQTKQGIIEQQGIQDSVASIRNVLPRVEDKTPSWLSVIGRVGLAGILIATFLILWQTGMGTLIKRLLFSVMFFIPSKTKRQVEMDLKVADENNPMSMREVIANRRNDIAYDMAYKKMRNKK